MLHTVFYLLITTVAVKQMLLLANFTGEETSAERGKDAAQVTDSEWEGVLIATIVCSTDETTAA